MSGGERPVPDEDTAPLDTAALVTAAADGDKAAWQGLVERFGGMVWSVARGYRLSRADAADVSQTVWLRLAENIGKINNPERVGAWLATATRRECLQNIRMNTRTVPTGDMALFEHAGAGLNPAGLNPAGSGLNPAGADLNPTEAEVLRAEDERESAHRAKVVWRALGRLPERCQQLLRILMASPPPSYAEIAAALDLPVGSIGPTRARCLQRLRQELGDVSGTA
jgi:RNA polymerase sigma factor (sigma-70 family)